MGLIDRFLQQIRQATYGKEVRESIAQGIEQCYSDAVDVVKVSETQPTGENVKLWVKPEAEEYQFPTWEEHLTKLDAPTTAGTSGQVLGLNDNLEPVWISMINTEKPSVAGLRKPGMCVFVNGRPQWWDGSKWVYADGTEAT